MILLIKESGVCFLLVYSILRADFTHRLFCLILFWISKAVRVRLKLKSPAEHFAQWDKSDSLICAAISLPFLYLPVGRCSQWNSQRNYPDLQGPRCWEERGGVWAKLCVTLTVRDNTSQQRLSKIRRERGEERQEIKTFAQTDAHTLTFLMLCFFSLFTAL